MSNSDNTGKRPNDAMPAGKPLEHDELASARDEKETLDEGFGVLDDTKDEEPADEVRENQAGTAASNPDKFK